LTIAVIIPACNEECIILDTLRRIRGLFGEIIVVDDCSDDDMALRLCLTHERVKFYRKSVRQGKGAAVKTGYKMLGASDYVAILDADLQVDPKDITTFLKYMDLNDADAVIGNKRHPFSNVERPFSRRLVSACYRLMIRLLFGLPLQDTQCGFKLFRRAAFDRIMERVLCKRFAFDLELLVCARALGLRVADAPVQVRQVDGVGSVSWDSIVYTFIDTLAVWWRHRRGWYAR
jgi:glycosyltransferase involved in cell wall biosynthesis